MSAGRPDPGDPMIAETSFGGLAMCCGAMDGHGPDCLRPAVLAAWQPEPRDGRRPEGGEG